MGLILLLGGIKFLPFDLIIRIKVEASKDAILLISKEFYICLFACLFFGGGGGGGYRTIFSAVCRKKLLVDTCSFHALQYTREHILLQFSAIYLSLRLCLQFAVTIAQIARFAFNTVELGRKYCHSILPLNVLLRFVSFSCLGSGSI